MEYKHHLFQTDVGWIALLATGNGLRRLSLKPTPQEALEELGPELDRAVQDPAEFAGVQICLERYLQGAYQALDEVELDLADAPPFFSAAWEACRRIPPGETRSYAWLGRRSRPSADQGVLLPRLKR